MLWSDVGDGESVGGRHPVSGVLVRKLVFVPVEHVQDEYRVGNAPVGQV